MKEFDHVDHVVHEHYVFDCENAEVEFVEIHEFADEI